MRQRKNKQKSLYNKQRNPCVSILRKNKKDSFENLNNKIVPDRGELCKTISSRFCEKAFHRACIILKESNKTITNNEEPAKTFNAFFLVTLCQISTLRQQSWG